jgi:hypothetical protein
LQLSQTFRAQDLPTPLRGLLLQASFWIPKKGEKATMMKVLEHFTLGCHQGVRQPFLASSKMLSFRASEAKRGISP